MVVVCSVNVSERVRIRNLVRSPRQSMGNANLPMNNTTAAKNHLPRRWFCKQHKTNAVMTHFTTLTEAMQALSERGYTHEFAPKRDCLIEKSTDTKLRSEEFIVDEFHRFEGPSDPGDEMTLYAITASNGMKGVFVSAQGTYANEVTPELMAKFNVSDRPTVDTTGAVQPIEPMTSSSGD
jgi:hypothetical protein